MAASLRERFGIGVVDPKGDLFLGMLFLIVQRLNELNPADAEAMRRRVTVIDFSATDPVSAYNLAAPWPGAWTEIADRIVTLVRVRVTRDFPRALEPGEAAVRGDGVAVVRSGDDAIELLEGRGEDDSPLGPQGLADLVRASGE